MTTRWYTDSITKRRSILKTTKVLSERPQFPGYLYRPDTPGPHPGILLLHGSEGGFGDFWKMPDEPALPTGESTYTAKLARHFATLGFVAYAYSYFHAENIEGFPSYPPNELADIDIKNTSKAFEWLKYSPYVAGLPVGICGGSRGAEQALILTSNMESLDIDLVIAHSPSDFVYPGFSQEAALAISTGGPFPEKFPSAWSIDGKPIEMYSPIEVEKIRAPIFVTYGAEDPIWGSYVDVAKLEHRLNSNGRESLHFDFSNNEDPKTILESIRKSIRDRKSANPSVFIRFLDEGHNPRPSTNSSLLQSMATELFVETFLSSS